MTLLLMAGKNESVKVKGKNDFVKGKNDFVVDGR